MGLSKNWGQVQGEPWYPIWRNEFPSFVDGFLPFEVRGLRRGNEVPESIWRSESSVHTGVVNARAGRFGRLSLDFALAKGGVSPSGDVAREKQVLPLHIEPILPRSSWHSSGRLMDARSPTGNPIPPPKALKWRLG